MTMHTHKGAARCFIHDFLKKQDFISIVSEQIQIIKK